ncbi:MULTISPECIES: hypothetical protein [Arsenophonus]|jgi:hypothetical protein|uniref:Uncharacterized protein n=1 Tax=Arsenophonus apicola TaxID=2879119 RepID=A0ABY8NYJ2_9GAMM|nr:MULTISPECIES: hypothetical protein [Arsenophonus]UBX30011.1 hypothetical protein LDL57_05135 [Arsenophonus apicola]UBX30221.1 hypothetical protein LDL57_06350 [Arsenophonus apicola]WGO82308.1 hypothetical protein QG404_01175 [Arsenophonus apicola]
MRLLSKSIIICSILSTCLTALAQENNQEQSQTKNEPKYFCDTQFGKTEALGHFIQPDGEVQLICPR